METNKRIFDTKQFKRIVFAAVAGAGDVRRAKRAGLIPKHLHSRIMLAVTEVNGCALCSYVHTRAALESGMPEEEIQGLLSGSIDHVEKDEAVALMFAQHYAETTGAYDRAAWQRVIDTYGIEKAKGILGEIRMIMMGNAYGIAIGALNSRIIGKPNKNSALKKELGVIFSALIYLPAAVIRLLFHRTDASEKAAVHAD